MAGITDKWVRHLRTRDRQDKAESHSFTCDICGDEIKTLETWLDHAKSDQEHQEKWPTLEAAQLSYVHKGSVHSPARFSGTAVPALLAIYILIHLLLADPIDRIVRTPIAGNGVQTPPVAP